MSRKRGQPIVDIVEGGKGRGIPGCLHCDISELVFAYAQRHGRPCLAKNVAQVLVEVIASESDPKLRAELIERTREFMDREIPQTVEDYRDAGRFERGPVTW
jgi:hypothetical protein